MLCVLPWPLHYPTGQVRGPHPLHIPPAPPRLYPFEYESSNFGLFVPGSATNLSHIMYVRTMLPRENIVLKKSDVWNVRYDWYLYGSNENRAAFAANNQQ